MNIATISTSRVFSSLLLISALGLLTGQILASQAQIIAAEERRFRSFQIAEALRRSSDELTRMARSYVITGDNQFIQRYLAIMDLRRRGDLGLNIDDYASWDLTRPPPRADQLRPSSSDWRQQMRRAGFAERELSLLQTAWQRSSELAELEQRAFAQVEAYLGDVSPAARAARENAINQLHDLNYHAEKARIMAPIAEFLQAVDKRTSAELSELQRTQRLFLQVQIVLALGLFLGVLLFTFYVRRKVLLPLRQLMQHAQALSRGDYSSRTEVASHNELALLGRTFNQMAEAIERDVAARRQLQQELETLACTDFLTQLSNRRHFIDQASAALARSRRNGLALAVCMLDVDHFKAINDQFGHAAGDLVLQHLAAVIQHTLREVDLCGRIGGEEFALLLPETAADEALRASERLRTSVANSPVSFEDGRRVHYSISIGVAVSPDGSLGLDRLLNQADAALYQAKAGGRNRVKLYEPPAVT
jgi:diguanylate cyclase (GGDEF)-like protein